MELLIIIFLSFFLLLSVIFNIILTIVLKRREASRPTTDLELLHLLSSRGRAVLDLRVIDPQGLFEWLPRHR